MDIADKLETVITTEKKYVLMKFAREHIAQNTLQTDASKKLIINLSTNYGTKALYE